MILLIKIDSTDSAFLVPWDPLNTLPSSGIATRGSRWGRVPPTAKNLPKIRGKSGKKSKNREEKAKTGRFFHFAPPDRAGYATAPFPSKLAATPCSTLPRPTSLCHDLHGMFHDLITTRISQKFIHMFLFITIVSTDLVIFLIWYELT